MTAGVFNGLAALEVDGDIRVLASPSVRIRRESDGGDASLFSDYALTVGISNPFTGNADGSFRAYMAVDRYRIDATVGLDTVTWRDVEVVSQMDVATLQTDVATLQADVATLQADVATLQADVATLQTGGALATLSVGQDISSGVETAIIWTVATYDTDNILQIGGGNPTRLTVPAGITRVQLQAGFRFEINSDYNPYGARLTKNGADFNGAPYFEARPSTSLNIRPSAVLATPMLVVTPGDYFELLVSQTNGASDGREVGPGGTFAGMKLLG
jgi:hypothetical protein